MDIVLNTTFSNTNLPQVQYPGLVDHFNAADGTLDYTEDGKAWTLIKVSGSGTPLWVRASGAAKLQSPSPPAYAVADALAADGTLTYTIRSVGASKAGYVMFRYVDTSNYLYLVQNGGTGSYKCYKYKAGVTTTLFNTSTASADGDVIVVTLSGSSITVTRNGSALGSATTSDFATSTKLGLYQSSADYTGTVESIQFDAAT